MEIKWYWLAEQMGYVRDVSEQYSDGARHLEVSAKVDDVFMILFLSLIPLCFMLGLLLRWILVKKKKDTLAKNVVWVIAITMFAYAVSLAVGIGPYIKFYPKGSGFIDLSVIEHIIKGGYCGFLAFLLLLGGKAGVKLATRGKDKEQ